MEQQPQPAMAREPDRPEAAAGAGEPGAEQPDGSDAPAGGHDATISGAGLWIALVVGIGLLLALCVVLAFVAYVRAPVGAPG